MADRPSVSSHLRIPLDEYDARIRTFVPYYEEMIHELASAIDTLAVEEPRILDLGVGTGALAERCLAVRPKARLIGIDSDPEILEMARMRLQRRGRVELRTGSFLDLELPESDLIVASISLHHVPTPEAKMRLYQRCREALRQGGVLFQADCFPPRKKALAEEGMEAWRAHLEGHYTREEAVGYLEAWSGEDTYFPLAQELEWLEVAGFQTEIVWRKDLFAVLMAS